MKTKGLYLEVNEDNLYLIFLDTMIIKMLYLDQNDESRIWQPSRPALLKLSRETTKTFPCHHSSTLVTLFFFRTNTKFEPPVFLTIVVLALNHPNVFVISSYLPIEIFVKFVFPICPFALVGMLSTNFRRVMIELSILFISILPTVCGGAKSGNCPVACIIPN